MKVSEEECTPTKRDYSTFKRQWYLIERLRERDENKKKKREEAMRFGVELSFLVAQYMFLIPNELLATKIEEYWMSLKRLYVSNDDKEVIQVLGKIVWGLRKGNKSERVKISDMDSLFEHCQNTLVKIRLKDVTELENQVESLEAELKKQTEEQTEREEEEEEMSSIYVLEPPTKGKVIVRTTHGPIDIELWPKEALKSVRNFVQLCLQGDFHNIIFHRVIPGFLVQGGDPTHAGTGGESTYGGVFADEFHSRLRFNPNETTTQIMIIALCKEGKLKEMVALLDRIYGKRCSPPVIVSTSLVFRVLQENRVEESMSLLEQLLQKNMAFSVGFSRFIIPSEPETAKEILNSSAFADRPFKEPAYEFLFHRAMGFAPYGEYWKNLKRIYATQFFSPRRIASFEGVKGDIGMKMVRRRIVLVMVKLR